MKKKWQVTTNEIINIPDQVRDWLLSPKVPGARQLVLHR